MTTTSYESEERFGFEPILEIRRGDDEADDVRDLVDVLVGTDRDADRPSHWQATAAYLLKASILHILYAEKNKTLAGLIAFLSDQDRPIRATLALMLSTKHLGKDGVHPVVARCARELLTKSDNEMIAIKNSAIRYVQTYITKYTFLQW